MRAMTLCGRMRRMALAMAVVVTLMVCAGTPAFAQDDWMTAVTVSVSWTDAVGQPGAAVASPLPSEIGQQCFFVQLPTGAPLPPLNIAVTNATHPDWHYNTDGIPMNAMDAAGVPGEFGLPIVAMDASGSTVDMFTLYVSTLPLNTDAMSAQATAEPWVTLAPDDPDSFETPEIYIPSQSEMGVISGTPVIPVNPWEVPALDGTPMPTETPVGMISGITGKVTVICRAQDGTELQTGVEEIQAGGTRIIAAQMIPGYTLVSGPDAVTVFADNTGMTTPSQVEFVYAPEQAAAAPATPEVTATAITVLYRADGNVVDTRTDMLNPGEVRLYEAKELAGYQLISDAQIAVQVNQDGSASPAATIVFDYTLAATPVPTAEPTPVPTAAPTAIPTTVVDAVWKTVDGTVLDSREYTLQAGDIQFFSAQAYDGLELISSYDQIAVRVEQDGTATPMNHFEFVYQPVATAPAEIPVVTQPPVTAAPIPEVTAAPVIPDLPVTVPPFTPMTEAPAAPTEAPTQAPVIITPAPTETPIPEITVYLTVVYKNLGYQVIAQQVIPLESGTVNRIAPDPSVVPPEYSTDSANLQPVEVTVGYDGVIHPAAVIEFVLQHQPNAAETPVPVGENINRWAVTVKTGTHLREKTSISSRDLGTISKTGTKVWAYRAEYNTSGESWTSVIWNGKPGYIRSDLLRVMDQWESDDYSLTAQTQPPMATATPTPVITPTPVPVYTAVPTAAPVTPTMMPYVLPTAIPQRTELPVSFPTAYIAPTAAPVVTAYVPAATPALEPYQGYALTKQRTALLYETGNANSVLTQLPSGTLVQVTGQILDSYQRVYSSVITLDSIQGYIADNDLRRLQDSEAQHYIQQWNAAHATATPNPAPATAAPAQITGFAYTIGDNIPFRSAASDKSVIFGMLSQDTAVYVAGQVYDTEDGWPWHVVQYNGQAGYIRADMLRMMSAIEQQAYVSGNTSTQAQTPQLTTAPFNADSLSSYGYIDVKGDAVNLRSQPSTSASRVKLLKRYALCLVTGTQEINGSTWYHVDYNGLSGYVSGTYFHQMTVAELEEFIDSDEYRQGIANNTDQTAQATPSQLVSPEQQNVNAWTDPTGDSAVVYATWTPIATTPPLATAVPTAVPTATEQPLATATYEPIATPNPTVSLEPIGTVAPERKEERSGSGLMWILLVILLIVGGGGFYLFTLHQQNKRNAAQRAAQRRAQAANQQRMREQQNARAAGQSQSQPRSAGYPPQGQSAGSAAQPPRSAPTAQQRPQYTNNSGASPYARPETQMPAGETFRRDNGDAGQEPRATRRRRTENSDTSKGDGQS